MKNPTITSITAVFVITTMLAGCATPNGAGSMAQGDPCQPTTGQSFFSPETTSFFQQAILSPLANIGGTLLATAAQNYSAKYTGKLNKLLTKLVTPKKKKKKSNQQIDPNTGFPIQDQSGFPGQIDPNTGFPIQDPSGFPGQIDPNTGLPIQDSSQFPGQIDPNTGFPIQDQPEFPGQDGFDQDQVSIDPNTGFPIQDPSSFPDQQGVDQIDPNTGFPVEPGFEFVDQGQEQEGFPQNDGGGFEDSGQFQPAVIDGDGFNPNIQSRGVPGQQPHATFPSQPCHPQQQVQGYPPANQPYGHDPAYQSGGYDPYQQGQDPYGQSAPYAQGGYPQDPYGQQPSQQDPYAQGGYPQDPYGQQPSQQDPYAQGGYPQDSYGQQPSQQDPYAQGGYPQDPYGQQPSQQDPYAQGGYPQDPYGQQPSQQDPYAQPDYSQDPNAANGYTEEGGVVGSPIGLDVVMLQKTIRNGATVMLPIKDGDALKDGRGNANAGDKFRIMFRPHTDGYVYVVAIDGSGWAQGIFPPPTSPLANPVKAGEEYVLPEGNNWFSLDQFKGIETIFFVASQEKRQDLEEVLQSITGRERPATATPHQVTKIAMVPYGVGGARPSAQGFNLATGSGQDQTIMPTSYFSKTAGEDLRLTRWFRHE